MSGINIIATKSDLLDRCILLELDHIPPAQRVTEAKMWAEFNAEKPVIMGMIFTVLSVAMSVFPTVNLEDIYRMSDFTEWGYAVAEAAGIGGERFLKAYVKNQGRANDEAIDSSPVAFAVEKLMENKSSWCGNASTLLQELKVIAEKENINIKSFAWPQQPNLLSRKLKEVKTNLEQHGITIENQTSGTRLIRIWKNHPAHTVPSITAVQTVMSARPTLPIARFASPARSHVSIAQSANSDNGNNPPPNGFVELPDDEELPF